MSTIVMYVIWVGFPVLFGLFLLFQWWKENKVSPALLVELEAYKKAFLAANGVKNDIMLPFFMPSKKLTKAEKKKMVELFETCLLVFIERLQKGGVCKGYEKHMFMKYIMKYDLPWDIKKTQMLVDLTNLLLTQEIEDLTQQLNVGVTVEENPVCSQSGIWAFAHHHNYQLSDAQLAAIGLTKRKEGEPLVRA